VALPPGAGNPDCDRMPISPGVRRLLSSFRSICLRQSAQNIMSAGREGPLPSAECVTASIVVGPNKTHKKLELWERNGPAQVDLS